MRQGPPKKPKMSRERFNELDAMVRAAGNNTVVPKEEWSDYFIAYRYYTYKPIILIGPGYTGQ